MRYMVIIAALMSCVGCREVQNAVSPQPQKVGPLTVVRAIFDYHQTLAFPDGKEFEFNHSDYQDSLGDAGSVVEIEFLGDLHSENFSNKVISVRVLKHSEKYLADHPELQPPRTGHWEQDSFVLDDDTKRICGSVDDWRITNEGWKASTQYGVARTHLYQSYTDKKAAKQAVERACR